MTATSGKVARTSRDSADRHNGEATSAKLRVERSSGSTACPICSTIFIAMPCSNGHSAPGLARTAWRSEEHTSELQSLMRISYAVFCLKKKTTHTNKHDHKSKIAQQE